MSKKNKLLVKLLRKPHPKDFSWDELTTLLGHHGFELKNDTKSSHVRFIHARTQLILYIARNHPPPSHLKSYQIKNVIDVLASLKKLEP